MTDEQTKTAEELDEVRRRLESLKESKRARVRWQFSRKTTELAIRALEVVRRPSRRTGKRRRQRRYKRLL